MMRSLLLVAAAAAGLAGGGSAVAQAYRWPQEIHQPADAQLRAAAPKGLPDGHGEAAFACEIQTSGVPDHCELLHELPAGAGVADAARGLIGKYSFAPALRNGVPAPGRAILNVRFAPGSYVSPRPRPELSGEDVRKVLPDLQRDSRIDLSCVEGADGALSECKAVTPAGLEPALAEAAQRLAGSFRIIPAQIAKRPTSALASISLRGDAAGVDTYPDWRKKPTPEDIAGVWPKAALSKGVTGDAVMECKVSLEGALFDCLGRWEQPAGSGFAAAAVALAPQLFMKPATKNGRPVVTTVFIPIAFRAAGGAPSLTSGSTTAILNDNVWLAAPTYAEAVAAFPEKARNSATPGHVTLNCIIKPDGGLGSCGVISEEPKGLGFAKAARDLSTRFRAPPATPAGVPTRGMTVHLPVTFPIEMLGGSPRIGRPLWISLPQPSDFSELPKTGQPGSVQVVLDCRIAPQGQLEDCKVASETPSGQNLGPAMLAVSSKFTLSLWTPEGLPTVGARVRVPIRYDLQ